MYVTSPEVGPDAKHPQKWYQKSEGALVMRMDTTKKGNKKKPCRTCKASRATSSKPWTLYSLRSRKSVPTMVSELMKGFRGRDII